MLYLLKNLVLVSIYNYCIFGFEEQCDKKDNCLSKPAKKSFLYNKITKRQIVNLGVVACGEERLEETLVMLKSALLFTSTHIVFHIFADDQLRPKFDLKLNEWLNITKLTFSYHVHPIQFPNSENSNDWIKLFKPCASQRLFIADILHGVDSLIYVDTDILFLSPVKNIYRFFEKFNSEQIAGMSPEHEEPTAGWYNRFAMHPYVPPYGINSGVMLMNLTRMRKVSWLKHIIPYYYEYRYKLTWGDQDLINIYFHFFPDKLFQFSCRWNYRPDHCMYMSTCKPAEEKGISILHGNRRVYHDDKQPIFKAIYNSILELEETNYANLILLDRIAFHMKDHLSSQCGQISHIFTKQLKKYLVDSK